MGSEVGGERSAARRLEAIMFTDMVSYSARVQQDEALAMQLLDEHRRLVRKLLPGFGGREVETAGDSFLIEFDSALDALHCGIALQQRHAERNGSMAPDRHVLMRVGLHIGDIEHRKGGKVFGDGVNLAARVEPLAPHGGIALSAPFHEQVRHRLSAPFRSLGAQALKNIAEPMEVLVLDAAAIAALPAPQPRSRLAALRPDWRWAAAVALLVAVSAAVVWQRAPAPASDDKSVAVLPFANLSGDPGQEFFSDGMTEEILNVLVKIPDLKVAARTSVFAFKDQAADVREIGKKLGVTHIVEGSIRRDATTIRITAQLIRVSDGFHVWSETYDRELKSVFAVQDEIARKIAGLLKGSLTKVEAPAARSDVDPQAYEDYLKARKLYRARTDLPRAIAHLDSAVARAPLFAQAWANLALAHEVAIWSAGPLSLQALGPALPQMRKAAAEAERLDPGAAMTLHAVANVARAESRFLAAEDLYHRAMAADPTYPDVREDYSELLNDLGRHIDSVRQARELVALEPFVPVFWNRLGGAGVSTGDRALVDEASARILEIAPDHPWVPGYRIDFAIARGDLAGARAAIEDARRSDPSSMDVYWVMWRWSQRDPAIDDGVARHWAAHDVTLAQYAAIRGDADLFFQSMAMRGKDHVRYNTYTFIADSGVAAIIADPRSKRLLRDRGFEAYWRVKGWPPRCKPKGEKDFECR